MEKKNIKKMFSKYTIISLGYSCCVKKYTEKSLMIKTHTNFFDYIGTSMWSINKLFENNFRDLFEINDYKHMQITNELSCSTNVKYYLRMLHDLKTLSYKDFESFKYSYSRKISRLYCILQHNKNILFIRIEEPLHKT